MPSFYSYDPLAYGSKGLVYIGNEIVVSGRDGKTMNHPYTLDLPGGCAEPAETPYETFIREVREELGVRVSSHDIHYVSRHSNESHIGFFDYFPVARLPKGTPIHFGDEGTGYRLMSVADFLADGSAWPSLQEYVTQYLAWRQRLGAPLAILSHT